MEPAVRHQCLLYSGAPSVHLPAVAAALRQKLHENYRCLYLNSPPMVAGIRSYLAAAGIDVAEAIGSTSLVLSSDRDHVTSEGFDLDSMLAQLADALSNALRDGYDGLWATGDMSWEFGPQQDFSKLAEYEWRLEQFLRAHPAAGGICQYHADALPSAVMRQGLVAHQSIYVNETLSRLNPYFAPGLSVMDADPSSAQDFDRMIGLILGAS